MPEKQKREWDHWGNEVVKKSTKGAKNGECGHLLCTCKDATWLYTSPYDPLITYYVCVGCAQEENRRHGPKTCVLEASSQQDAGYMICGFRETVFLNSLGADLGKHDDKMLDIDDWYFSHC